jgi:hypothetical protein
MREGGREAGWEAGSTSIQQCRLSLGYISQEFYRERPLLDYWMGSNGLFRAKNGGRGSAFTDLSRKLISNQRFYGSVRLNNLLMSILLLKDRLRLQTTLT